MTSPVPMRFASEMSIMRVMAVQLTTQIGYVTAIALTMIAAGLGKKRLEWRPRPRKRRKVWR